MFELGLLFVLALGSATVLPGGSEAYFLYLLSEGFGVFWVMVCASVGNTLGSLVNYYLGRYCLDWANEREYIKASQIKKGSEFFKRFGGFALLFSWAPIVGDAITFVAGSLRYSVFWFSLIVGLAKTLRYGFVYAVFVGVF